MSDQNDASGASSLIYGSAQDVTSQQRGLVASSSEQPVVPRILSTSSRTPHPQDMPPTFYEASSLNDLGPATASSSSTLNEEPEAPDPAIVDALRNAKERLFVLKLGESMENLVEQRRRVCRLFCYYQTERTVLEKHHCSSPRHRLTKGC